MAESDILEIMAEVGFGMAMDKGEEVTQLRAEIEQLRADANRYQFLRSKRSYYYGESYAEPSPREFGIAWQHQDSTRARPSFEEALDAEVAEWLKEQAELEAELADSGSEQ